MKCKKITLPADVLHLLKLPSLTNFEPLDIKRKDSDSDEDSDEDFYKGAEIEVEVEEEYI